MRHLFLAFCSLALASLASATVTVLDYESYYGDEGAAVVARAATVNLDPNATHPEAIDVLAVGVAAAGNGEFAAVSASAAYFGHALPDAGSGADLKYEFGAVTAQAGYSRSSGISGAAAQAAWLAVDFYSVCIYEEKDGVPGFSYSLDGGSFDCTGNTDADCIPINASTGTVAFCYDFKDYDWQTLDISETSCENDDNAVNDANANLTCTVWSINSATVDGMVEFTMHLASQPVLVGDVTLDPDHTKLDVRLNFDFASIAAGIPECVAGECGVTLASGALGYAGAGAAVTDGSAAFAWAAESGGYQTEFDWETTALVDQQNSTIYAHFLTGADLIDWSCPTGSSAVCGILTDTGKFNAYLTIIAAAYAEHDFETRLTWFSWTNLSSEEFFWDPRIGGVIPFVEDPEETTVATEATGTESPGGDGTDGGFALRASAALLALSL